MRVVDGLDAALEHIAPLRLQPHRGDRHATTHGRRGALPARKSQFAAVMVNASTRFNDGGELGLGAEIGISTTRLHAYGPMGLEALTIERFVVRGAGQVRHPDLLDS